MQFLIPAFLLCFITSNHKVTSVKLEASKLAMHNFMQVLACNDYFSFISTEITSSPLIYNAYLNSEERTRFLCISRNSDSIGWRIDGLQDIRFQVSTIRQIKSRIIEEQNESYTSELTIPAIPINQHIEVIKCEAYKIVGGFQVAESNETAQYHIQGLLEMKPNATYSSYNATHNQIQWLEPFTLNLTNIAHDIENYTVCSHIYLLNTEHALGCINSSDPQIYLPKYSVNLSLLITAWNVVGESNNSATLDIEACMNSSIENSTIGTQSTILYTLYNYV